MMAFFPSGDRSIWMVAKLTAMRSPIPGKRIRSADSCSPMRAIIIVAQKDIATARSVMAVVASLFTGLFPCLFALMRMAGSRAIAEEMKLDMRSWWAGILMRI